MKFGFDYGRNPHFAKGEDGDNYRIDEYDFNAFRRMTDKAMLGDIAYRAAEDAVLKVIRDELSIDSVDDLKVNFARIYGVVLSMANRLPEKGAPGYDQETAMRHAERLHNAMNDLLTCFGRSEEAM